MDNVLINRIRQNDKSKVPRGELWISSSVLKELGLPQTQESFIKVGLALGADICFFSYTSPVQNIPTRSPEMKLNINQAHELGLFSGVTVDGPFQRTVKERGFTETIKWFVGKNDSLDQDFRANTLLAADEMKAAGEAGADVVILCDDIAYAKGLYFSPEQFSNKLLPLYGLFKNAITKTPIGFHSDGNIEPILRDMVQLGFSVYSIEPEAMDLAAVCQTYRDKLVLLSGLKAEWLNGTDSLTSVQKKQILNYVMELRKNCNLILASLCGLYDIRSFNNLKEIYNMLDCEEH